MAAKRRGWRVFASRRSALSAEWRCSGEDAVRAQPLTIEHVEANYLARFRYRLRVASGDLSGVRGRCRGGRSRSNRCRVARANGDQRDVGIGIRTSRRHNRAAAGAVLLGKTNVDRATYGLDRNTLRLQPARPRARRCLYFPVLTGVPPARMRSWSQLNGEPDAW